nr:immunoglobulin heavy chain junction region [Mus musculus]
CARALKDYFDYW